MTRPCAAHGIAYRPQACPVCQALAGVPRGNMPMVPSTTCRHLGAETGETVVCPSCRGTVRVKLLACTVHGTCTAVKRVAGHVCCRACDDYTPK